MTDDLLDVTTVAKLLSVSKMTVYRLIEDGRLPAMRIGRMFRIPRSTLDSYLNSSWIEATP